MNHEKLLAYLTQVLTHMAEQDGTLADANAPHNFVREFYAELMINTNYSRAQWIKHLRETTKVRDVIVNLPNGFSDTLWRAAAQCGTPIKDGVSGYYVELGRRSIGLKEAKDFTEFMVACVRQVPHTAD